MTSLEGPSQQLETNAGAHTASSPPPAAQPAPTPPTAGVAQSPVSVQPDASASFSPAGPAGDAPQEGRSGRRPPGKRWRGQRGRRWRSRGNAARGFLSREALLAEGHPLAPSNTTDFLMDDHDDQLEADMLFDRYGQPTPRESPLAAAGGGEAAVPTDPFYCEWTPAALEPSVARLVAEHIQMEGHVEALEARICYLRRQRRGSSEEASDDEGAAQRGEVHMSPETAAKIRVLQTEIRKLEEENAALREGNERLAARGCAEGMSDVDESYTSDSESDSSSTSDSASSGSSRTSSSSGSESSDSSGSGSRSRSPLSPRAPASV